MAELSEPILIAIVVMITTGVVWKIMSERAARMVEEAMSQSKVEVATTEARLGALTDEKDTMQKQMQNAFEVAAANAFKTAVENADGQKGMEFKKATDELSKSMSGYIDAIKDADKADSLRVLGLEKEIGAMSKLGITLADETRELTLALRGDSQAQGAWGEVVVENLLQSMGFIERRDYVKQLSETGEDGKRKRTDFILNLPDKRQVVIDSKVSLTAYTEYVNAEDEEEAISAMKAHCTSIRRHAQSLASKNYQHMESINTLDFVLMVVPLESAFIDAMRADPSLYDDLVGDRRVKIVSGSSFMLALLLIQELWKRENQSRNQIELMERGGHLHDKVVTFLESFTTVGFELGQAKAAYDEAETQLTSGNGNVIRQTEMLRDLGAKVKKDLRDKSGVRLLAEEAEEE
jgi:DNA recombination protein RmuC|tara:strand:+ start:214 stop:1434 length:1221 start_codon:yes stop_codon:yes gene_type:complete